MTTFSNSNLINSFHNHIYFVYNVYISASLLVWPFIMWSVLPMPATDKRVHRYPGHVHHILRSGFPGRLSDAVPTAGDLLGGKCKGGVNTRWAYKDSNK